MSSNDKNQGKKSSKKTSSYYEVPGPDIDTSPMGVANETTRRAKKSADISFEPVLQGVELGHSISDSSMRIVQQAKQAPAAAKAKSQPSPAFVWKLQQVPTLPEFHPLERTAVFVRDSSHMEISGRISRVLRERSIEAEYENEKAKVKCVTPEGVECRVRLYRGRGEYKTGIIVEVQRRFGASLFFKGHCDAILSAAEGNPPPPPPALLRSSDVLPLVSDSEEDYTPPSGSESLKMVEKMFAHGGCDGQHLALQTLSSLTDTRKMGSAHARLVSAALLDTSNTVGSRVFDYICRREQEDEFKLRNLALLTLANALEAVKGQVESVIRELVRPYLLKELQEAQSTPRNAQLATRCFEYLYKEDHDQGEIAAAAEKAQAVGQARHAGLAAQTKRLLDKMML